MLKSAKSVNLIYILIRLFITILIIWIIIEALPAEYESTVYIIGGVLAFGLVVLVYFCVKNPAIRKKTFSILHKLFAIIGAANDSGSSHSTRKKRLPLTQEQKNEVYDIAGGKCQDCGKKGNLKIHHIDGNPGNNRITNLILLCGNHHDDADRNVIPKWRLKDLRTKQATPDHTSYAK